MFNTPIRFPLTFVCSTRPGYTFIILRGNAQLPQCHFLLYVLDAFVAYLVSLCVGVHLGFFVSFIWSSHPCHATSKLHSSPEFYYGIQNHKVWCPLPFVLALNFLAVWGLLWLCMNFRIAAFLVLWKMSLKILYRLHLAYSLVYGHFVNVNYSDP